MLRYNDPCVFIATVGRVHTSLQRVKLINSLFDLAGLDSTKTAPPRPQSRHTDNYVAKKKMGIVIRYFCTSSPPFAIDV